METLKNRVVAALRWSERYTKTDMVYLASGGMWLGLAQLTASISAFVVTVILANLLTQETLGEYRFLLSSLLVFSAFSLPGIRPALLESTPKGFLGNIRVAYKHTKLFSLIGVYLALCSSLIFISQENYSMAIGFVLIAIALPWLDASALYIEHLKSIGKFDLVAKYTTIGRCIFLVTSIGIAVAYPHVAWILLFAYLLTTILPNLFFFRKVLTKTVPQEAHADPNLLSYAKHLSVITTLTILAIHIDKVFIWHFLDAESLAIFFIALAIPQEISRFVSIIPILAFPKFSTGNPQAIHATLLPKIVKICFGTLFIIALYILMAPFIFLMLFPSYISAIPLSQVLALTILASVFTTITTYFTTQKRIPVLYTIAIVTPVIRILLCLVGIALFGLWGAVFALCIEAVISSCVLVVLFLRDKRHVSST